MVPTWQQSPAQSCKIGWLRARLRAHGRQFTVFLESLLADYDAIRVIFDTKGAGALKPCALCSNVLAKARAEADNDPFFMAISSSGDQSRFVGYNMTEFFAMYENNCVRHSI